ncbi:hypothetical protein LPJ38_13950 [Bradyrhizobium daqingense]|uniref:Uncharacterized protein n=1 Tax=Bradyrhizobium daqingense TaxID=993502 RepID=A0A562L9J3_9BRAD|nr:hypothetical protein [Bradyrhizobium daqingense]TWI04291.1 hypothetical protein IQ17_03615 [Bradyrhizobium daqingense]UFS91780.1 hypothetical protein LPJ38_13950 [Bradyrhizobium daqingense]
MLPGFRFLFAAILLSTSILVFGLGAAALLRASHEQYVSNPSWRNGPKEKVFAQAPEPAQPVLAVLRAEPEVAEPELSLRDQIPTIGLPVSEPEQVAALATEADAQPTVVAPPTEVPALEPAKLDATVEVAAAAPTDTLTPDDTTAAIPETKPADEPIPADPDAALASSALDVASAKLAALNDPAATSVKDAPAKANTDIKADSKATKPKAKAKAKKRQRVVRRPPPQQLQQQLDPFGQRSFATTTTRTR